MRPNSGGRSNRSSDAGNHPKNRSLNSQYSTLRPKANVVTARYRPRRRSAGMPTAKAATAPTRPPSASPSVRSRFQRRVNVALTAAPRPTMPIWPSEIWPAHPVSTTSDIPMTANTIRAVPLMT